jgi:DNA excision repair protein ERCC-2
MNQPSGSHVSWETLFPYDEPYQNQRAAIERIGGTIDSGGFAALEAACGTGKTLIALCVALEAIRDPSTQFERAVVLTSVRQQLRAFEDDLEAINENLPDQVEPVSAMTMVGKAHLCAYTQSEPAVVGSDEIYSQCDDLREPVRDAIGSAGTVHAATPQLQEMQTLAKPDGQRSSPLSGDDWLAPYKDSIPDDDGEYCPFYAGFRQKYAGPQGHQVSGVMRPWDLLREGAESGVCPHAMMMSGISNSEILVGNLKHAFHPLTVAAMTGEIIGQETIVIVDEAHGLVEGVRDELSDELSLRTIANAVDELKDIATSESKIRGRIREVLDDTVGFETVEDVTAFLVALKERLEQETVDLLDEHDSNWHRRDHNELPEEIRSSLRDAETPQEDNISAWISLAGWQDEFGAVDDVATALEDAYEVVAEETGYSNDNSAMVTTGMQLSRWRDCDHESYFRQFYLDRRENEWGGRSGYEAHYTAKLHLRNCIPRDEIADRLEDFGAGILMSATLSPLDVYSQTIGLDKLEAEGRRVERLVYGLEYPEENRESVAVDLPKFTRNNRGANADTATQDQAEVRDQYYQTTKATVQTTDGNVLVCFPNYQEARWVADRLDRDATVSKPVRSDGSDVESEWIRNWFVEGGPKVLCTGLRGTLTEGVDYDGDALAACVVAGLPLRSLAGDYPDAIEAAYESAFGSQRSFAYAFTLPAVHKSRQALGRVIRGDTEVGVRVLADRRYASARRWDDVRDLLPAYEQDEYDPVSQSDLRDRLRSFWN